ncbi:MAG: transposase [candidate division KSB1 bacterium]|nr:transposase [candidate division KSB1 bacterium]
MLNRRRDHAAASFLKKIDEFIDWDKLEVCSVVFKDSKCGRLVKAGLYDRLCELINVDLESRGVVLKRGTWVDATIVTSARRPRRKAGEKERSVRGRVQEEGEVQFTQKGGRIYYGYKAHIGADEGSGVIRRKAFTAADVHDSQKTDELISGDERSVFGDKAYMSAERKRSPRQKGVWCGILDKGYRNRPLSEKRKRLNGKKSRVRGSVERPFAHFKRLYGCGRLVTSI